MSEVTKYPAGSFAGGNPANGPETFHSAKIGFPVPSVGMTIEMQDGSKRIVTWVNDSSHGKRGTYQWPVKVVPKPGAAEWTALGIKNAKDESFEVWEIDIQTGTVVRMRVGRYTFPYASRAQERADAWEAEDAQNAAMEQRSINREFIVVESVTTYRRVES